MAAPFWCLAGDTYADLDVQHVLVGVSVSDFARLMVHGSAGAADGNANLRCGRSQRCETADGKELPVHCSKSEIDL